MNININEIVKTIREEGYIRIENFINAEVSKEIEDFMHSFNKDNYNKENLLERICFKREEGKNRQGDAYMVSLEDNKLGTIILDDGPVSDIFESIVIILSFEAASLSFNILAFVLLFFLMAFASVSQAVFNAIR